MKYPALLKKLIQSGSLTLLSIALWSCAVPEPSGVYSPGAPAPVADSPNFILKDAPPEQIEMRKTRRPGIATKWGDEVKSKVGFTSFNRNSKPVAVERIYYNDKEGIEAMTGNYWKYSGSGMQKAANGLVEWGIKSGWRSLKNVHADGKRFVIGRKGSNYAIVVKNLAHSRLEVVLSVDGLDVLTGKPASIKKRGYIIQPGQTLVVKGFRKSADAVAAFQFSSVADSYTNLSRRGTKNVGVIGMAVFTEKGVSPWRYGASEIKRRGGANPFADAPMLRARES